MSSPQVHFQSTRSHCPERATASRSQPAAHEDADATPNFWSDLHDIVKLPFVQHDDLGLGALCARL